MTPELRHIARRQAGCFTRRQAAQCGVSSRQLERYLEDGEWLHTMGDVLIVAGAPVTEAMKAWTGVLAIGQPVALAGLTGGRWIGLERVPPPTHPQFAVPNSRRPRDIPGLDVRRVVPEAWSVLWCRSLPVTPAPVVIRDIAGLVDHEHARDVVQHALRRRRVSFGALAATLGRGRAGSRQLRRVLEEVGPGFQVKWEGMVHRALLKRGIRMRPQTKVTSVDGRSAFIDLGIEDLKYGVEIDGFLNHMARFAADRRRMRMIAVESGWTIAPYAVEEIADHLDVVADEIAAEVRRRQRRAA